MSRFHAFVGSTLSVAALLAPSVSFADQCAVVTREKATSFLKLVKGAQWIGQLCEPCGETEMSALDVKNVKVNVWETQSEGKTDLRTLSVNGQLIDLAYTYILTGSDEHSVVMMNAAYMVGCEANGVSPRIIVGD